MICPLKWIDGLSLLELEPEVEQRAVRRFHRFYVDHTRDLQSRMRTTATSPAVVGKSVLRAASLLEESAGTGAMPPCCKVCTENFIGQGEMAMGGKSDPALIETAASTSLASRRALAKTRVKCLNDFQEDRQFDSGFPLGALVETSADASTAAAAASSSGGCPPMKCCKMCPKQLAVPREFLDVNFLQERARERRLSARWGHPYPASAGFAHRFGGDGGGGYARRHHQRADDHRFQSRSDAQEAGKLFNEVHVIRHGKRVPWAESHTQGGKYIVGSEGDHERHRPGGEAYEEEQRWAAEERKQLDRQRESFEARRPPTADSSHVVEHGDSDASSPPPLSASVAEIAPVSASSAATSTPPSAAAGQDSRFVEASASREGQAQGQHADAGYNNMGFWDKGCCRICKWRITGELGMLPYGDGTGDPDTVRLKHPKNPFNKRSYR